MKDNISQEITFRKLNVFMMFMQKGNIARTPEALDLGSGRLRIGTSYSLTLETVPKVIMVSCAIM